MPGDDISTWEELKARLNDEPRGTPYRLAGSLGLNPSYFYRKLGKGGALTVAQAKTISAFFSGELGEAPEGPPAAATAGRRRLPVFGYAAAGGEDLIAMNDGEIIDWIELPMGLELGPGDWFVVLPAGSSMEPRIFAGEPQVVRRNTPPIRGKDVVVEFADGTGVIKTYKGQRDGQVFVEQWNEHRQLNYDATKVKALHGVSFKL